jgi:hypothetical protein
LATCRRLFDDPDQVSEEQTEANREKEVALADSLTSVLKKDAIRWDDNGKAQRTANLQYRRRATQPDKQYVVALCEGHLEKLELPPWLPNGGRLR